MGTLALAEHVVGISIPHALERGRLDIEFFAKVQAAVVLRGDEILFMDHSLENIDAAFRAGWQAFQWTKDRAPKILRSLCA